MQYSKPVLYAAGILGLFFLLSGLGKALDVRQFADTITSYGFPQLRLVAPVVIAAEICLGLGSLLRLQLRRLALASVLLLAVFTVLFAYGYLWHGINACGCFGALEALQTPPWVSFVRNGVLLLLAGWLYRAAPLQARNISSFEARAAGLTLAILLSLSGYLYASKTHYSKALLVPGQAVEGSALAQYRKLAPKETHLIFVFSPTCPHCWAATPQIMSYQRRGLVNKIIALCPPSTPQEQQKYLQHFHPPFAIQTVDRSELRKLTTEVPTIILVHQDTIRTVAAPLLPHADSLRLLLDLNRWSSSAASAKKYTKL